MSTLRRIEAPQVRATIAEFLAELDEGEDVLRGGIGQARSILEQNIAESVLVRILDDLETPSAHNVWQKLTKVSDEALADFLTHEHPQTAAAVISKFAPEHAARILNRFDPDLARDVVVGISRVAHLDPSVVEAIGETVSREFLASRGDEEQKRNPADRVGAIMNYTSPAIRDHILDHIETDNPDFADEVRRKMFTFDDLPIRVPTRGVPVLVRSLDQEVLLRALFFSRESSPDACEFILRNISSRMAEQLREELGQVTSVRRKDGERAQADVIRVIRELVAQGEIELVEEEES